MSEVKVNKISPRTACGTVTLGDSGDTFTIPSGATITNSGTATGFGRTGTVDWDTSIHTSTVTAASGKGYFVNTTGGGVTVNLPAASVGDIVAIKDYAGTFNSNACTIAPNGSDNIGGGSALDPTLTAQGGSVTLVYADATQGWLATQENVTESPSGVETFMTATGGTPSTSGDYKIHTFTGPGCFQVTALGSTPANDVVSYIVVAGGGGGGGDGAGGGGAGGYREGKNPADPYTASPLAAACSEIPVSVTTYPITVGGGGTGISGPPWTVSGTSGSNSIFSTITSDGGGGGSNTAGTAGGSGGGGGRGSPHAGAAGDTPPTTPDQGFAGGNGDPSGGSGGGGGALAVGANTGGNDGGDGGIGANSDITGSTVGRSGGGGAATTPACNADGGNKCGTGGGAYGGGVGVGSPTFPTTPGPLQIATAGTVNTGGGAGGGTGGPAGATPTVHHGAAGGSGIVIIRYKFQ